MDVDLGKERWRKDEDDWLPSNLILCSAQLERSIIITIPSFPREVCHTGLRRNPAGIIIQKADTAIEDSKAVASAFENRGEFCGWKDAEQDTRIVVGLDFKRNPFAWK